MANNIKIYLLSAFILIVLSLLIFSAYHILTKNKSESGSYFKGKENTGQTGTEAFIPNPPSDSNSNPVNPTGSGGSSGSGGSGSSGSSGGASEKVWIEPFVKIIKPQDGPSVDVALNYLNSNAVSLKIINTIGENTSVLVKLTDCPPEISEELKINEEKDFIFSCNNNGDYFDEDLFITYTYSGLDPITMYGVVRGSIS